MEEGRPKEAIDTNVDVDWGNNLYICSECASVIADLLGRVEVEDHQDLKLKHRELKNSHKALRTKFKALERDYNRVVAGRKAEARRERNAA
jgi:hypothetical protein